LELHQVSDIFSEKLCSMMMTYNLQQIVTVIKLLVPNILLNMVSGIHQNLPNIVYSKNENKI